MSLFRSLPLALAAFACYAAPIHFRTHSLPWAAIGANYAASIEIQANGHCPIGDVGLAVVDGELPRGLELTGNVFTGVPREVGTFHFRVRAANTCSAAEQDFALLVTGKPVLRVFPAELTIEYHVGGPMPPPQSILVTGTWPELPYSVSGDTVWARTRQAQGFTPLPGSALAGDTVSVDVNPKDFSPGTYETVLTFAANQGATAPSVRVRLNVLPN